MNITLSIDEKTVKRARKIAAEKNTTLTAMVRDYLILVANVDAAKRTEHIAKLKKSFQQISRNMGPRAWTREDLHVR